MDENEAWEKEESQHGDEKYWRHRHYLDLQVRGVYDGYMLANKGKPERVIKLTGLDARHCRSGRFSMRITMVTWATGTVCLTTTRSLVRRMRLTVWTTARH